MWNEQRVEEIKAYLKREDKKITLNNPVEESSDELSYSSAYRRGSSFPSGTTLVGSFGDGVRDSFNVEANK